MTLELGLALMVVLFGLGGIGYYIFLAFRG